MKDFLTIFFGLCLAVGGFMAGRNYGEKTFRETAEFRELVKSSEDLKFTRSELETAKTKFQNILDSSDTKKQEELLAQILQVFLADLGLKAANQTAFLKTPDSEPTVTKHGSLSAGINKKISAEITEEKEQVKVEKQFDLKKLKSYEWILTNSTSAEEVQKNLKNVEIKNLSSFLRLAKEEPLEVFEPVFGTYRGRMFDVLKNEYGSMLMDIKTMKKNGKDYVKGDIKIFMNGVEKSGQGFESDHLGYKVDGSDAFLINFNNGNKYWHVYKLKDTQQLAGFMYDQMVNGTTKTVGSFVLNRTDQF